MTRQAQKPYPNLAIANIVLANARARPDQLMPATIACLIISLVIGGAGHAYPLKERLIGVTNYSTPAQQALAAGDFDEDGEVEIALSTAGPAPLLVVLERAGQRWRPGQVMPLSSIEKTMRLLPWRRNNGTRLVGIELPGDNSPNPANGANIRRPTVACGRAISGDQ